HLTTAAIALATLHSIKRKTFPNGAITRASAIERVKRTGPPECLAVSEIAPRPLRLPAALPRARFRGPHPPPCSSIPTPCDEIAAREICAGRVSPRAAPNERSTRPLAQPVR